MTAPRTNWKTRLTNLAARTCDAIDEVLYGRELAIARAHQAAIEDLLAKAGPGAGAETKEDSDAEPDA